MIHLEAVSKPYGAPQPLRVRRFTMRRGEAIVVRGLDASAAEMFVNLLTGASLPDEGHVRIDGRDTRDISTDTEWLASLDRFGLVTLRAVLIGQLPVRQNLALPMTLSIDPMADDVGAAVERLADDVGLARVRLAMRADTLAPAELVRVHLARALAVEPAMLLLEHPTAGLTDIGEREAFGALVAEIGRMRGLGWRALSDDEAFMRGTRAVAVTLEPNTGAVSSGGWWSQLMTRWRS